MPLGQLARRILGTRFQPIGELYRAIFVDIGKVAEAVSRAIPSGAHCLDVGGGDGMLVDALLRLRPDIRVTMTDIAPEIGGFIAPERRNRVKLRPATSLAELAGETLRFHAVLIADVLHHVPPDARSGFLRDLVAICARSGSRILVVKDIEPGSLRSVLSVLSDKYVTGDRAVSLVASPELRARLQDAFGPQRIAGFEVTYPDPPNYCAVARLID